MDYANGEVIEGCGTQLRYAVLEGGSTARPPVAEMKTLTGVTTSELGGNQDTKEVPGDYESCGQGGWKDSKPGKRGWSFTMSANKKVDTAQAAMLKELWLAWEAGKYVWVERLLPNDTEWVGGLAFITDPKEPAPWDGAVTFSCGFTGKKRIVRTDA